MDTCCYNFFKAQYSHYFSSLRGNQDFSESFYILKSLIFYINMSSVNEENAQEESGYYGKEGFNSDGWLIFKFDEWDLHTVGKRRRRKKNTPIYFNTNYHIEMKLVPISMDCFLLQFDA